MKRPYEKPILTNQPSNGTATGLPAMKRPYEKPTLTDLSRPDARAGWLSGDNKASPQGLCYTGTLASPGVCGTGQNPDQTGLCFSGLHDSGGNLCVPGTAVR
jgi:hypothetical protein